MGGTDARRGTLAGDLEALLSSGHAADVTIMADGVWIPAHRAVLTARSKVFGAIFRQELLKVTGGTIKIQDINHEVLGQLLHFMYTDEAPLLECFAAELLAAADKYCVSALKRRCERQLIASLSVENAADSAVLAFLHMCPKLKAATVSFISEHYREVMATAGWEKALRQHTEVSVEVCRLLGMATVLESEWYREEEEPAAVEDGEGRLAGDLLSLLESAEGSDVTLVKDGVQLPAHRAVLAARSPVLAERLQEAPGGILQVGAVGEEELRAALHYAYSDQLPPPEGVTAGLLALADDCALSGLKDYCEGQLAEQISVENAVSVAVVATEHSFTSLRKACVDFIVEHIFEVMDTDDWATAIRNDADMMVNISKAVAAAQRALWESGEESSD